MHDFRPHDVVQLDRPVGRWPAGTVGTIVDDFPGGVVVEIAGPSGETLDLLDLPPGALSLVSASTEDAHAVGA